MEPLMPSMAIGGGLLIGTAVALLLLLVGRIAGVSGMIATATALRLHRSPGPCARIRRIITMELMPVSSRASS